MHHKLLRLALHRRCWSLPPPAAVANPGPATDEAQAVRMLHELGVEPGSLVGLNLAGLNAIYRALTDKRTAPARSPPPSQITPPLTPLPPPSTQIPPPSTQPSQVPVAEVSQEVPTPSSINAVGTVSPVAVDLLSDFPTTKEGALQALERLNVPNARVSHFDHLTLKRLHSMMTFADTAQHYYAVNNIKVSTDWGIPTSFNNASNVLCEKGTSKRLTLWILGEVASQFWFSEDGYPAKRVGLSVQPFASDIHEFCKRLLHGLCMPRNSSLVADGFGPDQVRATHWMTRRGQKGLPSATDEFTEFYDARATLKDKSSMAKLSVEDIIEHDPAGS
ncbi:hypothetical protein R3P38DRAFT_3236566 [Favolaschia claudopus]|uniref:Uncharacterized protein n=1 Tax=Favolaschia claudopus TaxID=2862362 RepID=A0AAV9ZD01_9AGAR